ncbi:inositol monophosphatase family protein [Isoptericola variabilis]|uniref:inositol monophosphatase family protein n=1 Tax=Isoptericola variabilis TaxID=139208 RepID=UPI003D253EF1
MPSTIEQVADRAMDLALSLLHRDDDGERVYKTDRDFATVTDFAIEDAVREFLAHETPDTGFLGEERGHTGDRKTFWCLDPVDGTTNFTRSVPNYGVSLALIEHGASTLGTIALPAHGERYASRKGTAYLNGQPIHVSKTASLHDALVSTGDFATGTGSGAKNARRLAMIGSLAGAVGRVRMLGSAATDLAWLAAGRLDAVVIDANRMWDVAGGIAIARAAGAVVTHVDGSDYTLDGPDVLATAPAIHGRIVDLLS